MVYLAWIISVIAVALVSYHYGYRWGKVDHEYEYPKVVMSDPKVFSKMEDLIQPKDTPSEVYDPDDPKFVAEQVQREREERIKRMPHE